MKRLLHTLFAAIVAGSGHLAAQSSLRPQDDPAYLKKAALQVDQQIANFYRLKKLPVPAVTDDATFVRRAFLVAAGRIPTAAEAMDFLEMEDADKRALLISYLLKSKGYSSTMSNWAFDLLRLTDGRTGTSATNEPYRFWVRTAVTSNMPWDEFTRRLIASRGDGWDQATAAVGYYTRDRGMPLDNLSNSMRIFLGARMECAQCHDDPFGTTERHQFYSLAAFTHGQETLRRDAMEPLWREVSDDQRDRGPEYAAAQTLWDRVYGMSLGGGGSGQIALPSDYQYRDGHPGDLIGGRTPFGKVVRMSDRRTSDDGREKMADWMISRTGEQFPGIIANRMWKRVMGKGIYEPFDEYIPAEKTNAPELTRLLGKLMVDLGYDLRAFQHVLMLTKTFQFATNPNPSTVQGGDDFNGRKIERLSAEQIWDSLITLAGGDPDEKAVRGLDDRIYVRGKPVLVGKKTMTQLSREVLALKTDAEVRSYFAKFLKDIDGGRDEDGASMMVSMTPVKGYDKNALVRASELPSPAPRDHFLYLFGASDREVVEAASRDPNVGQVLSLMNGFVQRELVNKSSAALYQSLEGASSDEEKIRRLYVAILTRPPTDEEMGWMREEVSKRGEGGLRNIVSALVMSSEFLFLQ